MSQSDKYVQQVDEATFLYYPMDYTPIPSGLNYQFSVAKDKVGDMDLTLAPVNGGVPTINHPNKKDTIINFYSGLVFVSGASDSVIPDTFVTHSQGNWTISGWFFDYKKPPVYSNTGMFGFAGSQSTTTGEQYNTQFSVFRVNSTDQIVVRTQHGNSLDTSFTTTGSVPTMEWYHLAITKETGSVGDATFKVYINGILDTESVISNSTGDLDSSVRWFTIANYSWREGACDKFAGSVFNWQMDDVVRDSHYILSASQTHEALIDEHTIHLYDMVRDPDIKDCGPYGFHLYKDGNGTLVRADDLNQVSLAKISNNFYSRTIPARDMEIFSTSSLIYPKKIPELLTGSWTLELVSRVNTHYRDSSNNTSLFYYGNTQPTSNPSAEYSNVLFFAEVNNNSVYVMHHSGAYTGASGRLAKLMHTFPSGSIGDYHYFGFTKEVTHGGVSCSYKMYIDGDFVNDFSCSNCTTTMNDSFNTSYLNLFNVNSSNSRNGQLSEVKLSTDVKSPEHFAKIADLYRKKKTIAYGGIVNGEIQHTFTSPPSESSTTWVASVSQKNDPKVSENVPFEISDIKKQVPGILAWWKSDSGVNLDGSLVDSWEDQSGNGLHLDLVESSRPIFTASHEDFNGYPAIVFSGSQDLSREYESSGKLQLFPNGMTCFAVVKTLSGWATYSTIMGSSDGGSWTNGWAMGSRDSTGWPNFGLWFNSWSNYVQKPLPVGTKMVACGRVMDSRISCRTNGSNLGFDNRGSNLPSTTRFSVGRAGASYYPGQFVVTEIIMYDRELSYGEIVSVENYLRTKYNI